MKTTLPTDSAARKRYPLRTGCFNYFPAALAGVAQVSIDGNDKHNQGEPLHHARGKSGDHADCIDRHLTDVQDLLAVLERGQGNLFHEAGDDGVREALLTEVNQLAWRALALSQEMHEKFGTAPLAPAAKLPVTDTQKDDVSSRTIEDWESIHQEELKKLRDKYYKPGPDVTDPIRPYEVRRVYLGNGVYQSVDPNGAQAPSPQVPNGYSY